MSFYDDVRKRFPLQLEALEKAVQEDKIAHAYLIKSEIPSDRNDFAGRAGCGAAFCRK